MQLMLQMYVLIIFHLHYFNLLNDEINLCNFLLMLQIYHQIILNLNNNFMDNIYLLYQHNQIYLSLLYFLILLLKMDQIKLHVFKIFNPFL